MMFAFLSFVPYAAVQAGVILIAAVLWFDFSNEDRRRRLVRNLQSVLNYGEENREEKKPFRRAA